MSEENVGSLVRAGFENVERSGHWTPTVGCSTQTSSGGPPQGWPEPGPYVGREAVMRQLKQLRGTWNSDSFELISDFVIEATGVYTRAQGQDLGH